MNELYPEFVNTMQEWHGQRLILLAEIQSIKRRCRHSDSLYLVARGQVQVHREDKQQPLAILSAGDFFGEMALLHEAPRTASVTSLTPTTLYRLKRHDLEKAMKEHPGIQTALEQADQARQSQLDPSCDRH